MSKFTEVKMYLLLKNNQILLMKLVKIIMRISSNILDDCQKIQQKLYQRINLIQNDIFQKYIHFTNTCFET